MRRSLLPLILLLTLLGVRDSVAQDYPRGTVRLTPRVSHDLVRVPVEIPEAFDHLPDDLTVNLPPGFRARVYAAFPSVRRPRFMAFDGNGVLHVANMDDDQIVALPDRDGDGVADEAIVAAEGFSRPHSIAFHEGALYVGDRPQILRFRDLDGDLVYEEREVLVDNIPSSGSHSTRTLVIDAAKQKIYLGVGWPCDLCRVDDPERGAVLEFNLDGSGRRVVAGGVRNLVGMTIDPRTGNLWATNNGHDLEGVDAPPEWIAIIREGGFYGMPFAYGYGVWADFTVPAYRDAILPLTRDDSLKVESMGRPAAMLPAHTAPMGIHFYDQERFPPRYRHAAFVSLHAGHAKLAPIEGYSVIALFAEPDGSRSRYEDFLTGFQRGTEIEDVWGYPMGLTTDDRGRLYVSSDLGNRLILQIDHGPLVAESALGVPDSIASGAPLHLDGIVHLRRLAPEAGAPQVTADLSDLGGPATWPLIDEGDGRWRLRATVAAGAPGLRHVRVTARQPGPEGDITVRLVEGITVLPTLAPPDLVLFGDDLAPGWQVLHKTWLEDRTSDLDEDGIVFAGERSASFRVNRGEWDWVVRFKPPEPLDPTGYGLLRFAFHAGPFDRESTEDFNVYALGGLIDLVEEGLVDITSKEWQTVEIPLSRFGSAQRLREITFGGDFSRRFYLDEVRLVAASPPTAVTDGAATPADVRLEAAYPNPFNSGTVIPFSVERQSAVRLTIFNLAGQRVVALHEGEIAAGPHEVRWDGRNTEGQEVASGAYFVRFEAAGIERTRKLLLLR